MHDLSFPHPESHENLPGEGNNSCNEDDVNFGFDPADDMAEDAAGLTDIRIAEIDDGSHNPMAEAEQGGEIGYAEDAHLHDAAKQDSREQSALELKSNYQARLRATAADIRPIDNAQLATVYRGLSSQLHENWRQGHIATHRTGDGPDDYEPRWKPVGDDHDWLDRALHNPQYRDTLRRNDDGTYDVDIAHVPFESLPNNPWIIDNHTGAVLVSALVHWAVTTGVELDEKFLERASSEVHGGWQYRHPDVHETSDNPEVESVRSIQRLPYADENFTEEERNKDREHVVLAAEIYADICRRANAENVSTPSQSVEQSPSPLERVKGLASRVGSSILGHLNRETHEDQDPALLIPEMQLPRHASNLLSTLQEVVANWSLTSERPTDEGGMVQTYDQSYERMDIDGQTYNAHYTAQLSFDGSRSRDATPSFGNLSVYRLGYESYVQVSPGSAESEDQPQVYFSEHGFHQENIATQQINTWDALTKARDLIINANPQSIGGVEAPAELEVTDLNDTAYEQIDMIHHPITGELTPARELLDDVHSAVRAREIVEQEEHPRPETTSLSADQVPREAFDLLMTLKDSVANWELAQERVTDNGILRTLTHTVSPDGERVFFEAHMHYATAEDTTPTWGCLVVNMSDGHGWMREYYFEAGTVPRQESDSPQIRYDDYPYHEEDMGRPEVNTHYGLERAKRLISFIQKS